MFVMSPNKTRMLRDYLTHIADARTSNYIYMTRALALTLVLNVCSKPAGWIVLEVFVYARPVPSGRIRAENVRWPHTRNAIPVGE